MGLFDFFKKKEEPPKPAAAPAPKKKRSMIDETPLPGCKQKTYKGAGTSFRKEAFLSIASENPDFGMTKSQMVKSYVDSLYKYSFAVNSVELVPDTDNKSDPNAVKIVVNGAHLGYIKSGNCAHVRNVLNQGRMKRLQAVVYGGPCKLLEYIGEIDGSSDPDDYVYTKDTHDFGVKVYADEAEN